jgi:hypothetical protein
LLCFCCVGFSESCWIWSWDIFILYWILLRLCDIVDLNQNLSCTCSIWASKLNWVDTFMLILQKNRINSLTFVFWIK